MRTSYEQHPARTSPPRPPCLPRICRRPTSPLRGAKGNTQTPQIHIQLPQTPQPHHIPVQPLPIHPTPPILAPPSPLLLDPIPRRLVHHIPSPLKPTQLKGPLGRLYSNHGLASERPKTPPPAHRLLYPHPSPRHLATRPPLAHPPPLARTRIPRIPPPPS